mmetsp:Transcript_10179/g.18657  ORF Transcript_10179/g.18657 Transcript_10179/m.18657 type:complete len:259 (-) Transcript_10179:1089-1865(-)
MSSGGALCQCAKESRRHGHEHSLQPSHYDGNRQIPQQCFPQRRRVFPSLFPAPFCECRAHQPIRPLQPPLPTHHFQTLRKGRLAHRKQREHPGKLPCCTPPSTTTTIAGLLLLLVVVSSRGGWRVRRSLASTGKCRLSHSAAAAATNKAYRLALCVGDGRFALVLVWLVVWLVKVALGREEGPPVQEHKTEPPVLKRREGGQPFGVPLLRPRHKRDFKQRAHENREEAEPKHREHDQRAHPSRRGRLLPCLRGPGRLG